MDFTHAASGHRYFTCPVCETGFLRALGRDSAKCSSCGCLISGAILTALKRIQDLPEVVGGHACECGHPEMRRLPDGVFRCPSCGSEVLPVAPPPNPWKPSHSEAYWSGWMDGRFHDTGCFADNSRLSGWKSAPDRLDYYRGHRSGREARNARKRDTLRAS